MLTRIMCPTHPTRKALRKPCGRSALRSVASRAAALEFGMGDMWFKSAVM